MEISKDDFIKHLKETGFVSTTNDKDGKVETCNVSSEAVEKIMPDDITPDLIKKAVGFQKAMVETVADATGTVALEMFEKDKDLQRVNVNADTFAGTSAHASAVRSTEVNTAAPGKEPVMETRYNNLTMGFTTKAGKKGAALRKITAAHQEAGKTKLA